MMSVAYTRKRPHVGRRRPVGAIDFDGVVHSYELGWNGGEIYGEQTPGCADALRRLSVRYDLVLFTARHNLDDVRAWLTKHHLIHYFSDITNRKPAAEFYLDDRAIHFTDWVAALDRLL